MPLEGALSPNNCRRSEAEERSPCSKLQGIHKSKGQQIYREGRNLPFPLKWTGSLWKNLSPVVESRKGRQLDERLSYRRA